MTALPEHRAEAPAAPAARVARVAKPRTRSAAPASRAASREPAAPLAGASIDVTAHTAAPPSIPARRVVTDEDIRVRAYFLSLEHGGNGHSDVDFWLLAERELRPHTKSTE
jgi:hypothetical protein